MTTLIDIDDANAIGDALMPVSNLLLNMVADANTNGGTMKLEDVMELIVLQEDVTTAARKAIKNTLNKIL